jgi:hypothetical protein
LKLYSGAPDDDVPLGVSMELESKVPIYRQPRFRDCAPAHYLCAFYSFASYNRYEALLIRVYAQRTAQAYKTSPIASSYRKIVLHRVGLKRMRETGKI